MLQSDRALVGRPFVLQVRDPRRGWIVAASSPLARNSGILPGMSISEACSLGKSEGHPRESTGEKECQGLVLMEYDPQEDLDAICWCADAAQRFSPIVGLETLDAKLWAGRSLHHPQSLILDATNLAPIFGGEEAMAGQIQQWFAQQGYQCCVAIAGSVGAAWGAANYGNAMRQRAAEALLLQNREGPPAIPPIPPVLLEEGGGPSYLAALPIEALRLELEVVKMLHRLGIRSIGELVALPRSGLASRFGTGLIDRIDQAWGLVEEPIASFYAEPEFSVELLLEHATDRRETLEELVRRLTQQLCDRMLKRGKGALSVICRMECSRGFPIVLQLGLFRATAESEHLIPLLIGQFDQQWERAVEIQKIALQATCIGELTWQQPELFDVDHVGHRDSMARLVDKLSSRLGRRAILTPQLHRDPQPELACRWRPLTGRRANGAAQKTSRKFSHSKKERNGDGMPRVSGTAHHAEPQIDEPFRRPLTLIQPPRPIDVLVTQSDGPPIRFRIGGHIYHTLRYWGAERIESGWWRGPSHRRDYFRVETEDGAWLWLFQSLHDHQWFLHGEFD